MTFDNILNQAFKKATIRDLNEKARLLPKSDLIREPSLNETKAVYQAPGTGLLFCIHGRSFFETCSATTCRRGKKEADQRMKALLDGVK